MTAGLAKGCKLLESIEMAGEFVKKIVINGEWGTLNQFTNSNLYDASLYLYNH